MLLYSKGQLTNESIISILAPVEARNACDAWRGQLCGPIANKQLRGNASYLYKNVLLKMRLIHARFKHAQPIKFPTNITVRVARDPGAFHTLQIYHP